MTISNQSKILVCNVGWMARYQGLKGQPDSIVGGGKWVKENKQGHESCNFLVAPSGDVFGHFETIKGEIDREVSIEKLGATDDAEYIDHIDVVWVATDPHGGGRRVIGYYRDARVYRRRQKHGKFLTKQHRLDEIRSYRVSTQAKNMKCLALEDRCITLGKPPGWIGQANWWFPANSLHPGVPAFLAEVRALLTSHNTLPQRKSAAKKWGRQSLDPARNALIEAAAIDEVTKHYIGKKVRSVEKDNVGWDLEIYQEGALIPGSEPLYRVEVKGLSGPNVVIGVTPNEYRYMKAHLAGSLPCYRIAVVTSVLTQRRLHIFKYDRERETWIDEIQRKVIKLKIDEKMAAIVSLV